MTRSTLDGIASLGPVRKASLTKEFGVCGRSSGPSCTS